MLTLHPFQREAIEALSSPLHLICVAPTGSGKSLIYEHLVRDHAWKTVLVTPLVALARQQAERLESHGISVALGAGSYADTGTSMRPGRGTRVWIVSPETLVSGGDGMARIRDWVPEFLVVDECHCFWDWGEHFRPAFRRVPEVIRRYAIQRSLWLTATLPPQARSELLRELPEPRAEQGRFDLPAHLDLLIERVPLSERVGFLLSWISVQKGPGIIFVPTRGGTERLARALRSGGVTTLSYHAGMSTEERRSVESELRTARVRAVVATSAFGMGMDFAATEWVVVWGAPPSLLFLAQAIGRTGRTRKGKALVLWHDQDFDLLSWWGAQSPRAKGGLTAVRDWLFQQGDLRQHLIHAFETKI